MIKKYLYVNRNYWVICLKKKHTKNLDAQQTTVSQKEKTTLL